VIFTPPPEKQKGMAMRATFDNSEMWQLERATAGILAPGRWFWLRSILWTLCLFAFAALTFFASLQLGDWMRWPMQSQIYIGIFTPILGLVGYALAVRFGERRWPLELSLARVPAYILLGTLVGFSFMALSLAMLRLFHLNDVGLGHWRHWFGYLVFNAYISGVVEELGFRAILLRLLARMFGPLPGLLISSLLFALAHAHYAPFVAVALLIVNGGLLLGILYMISGSLWLPIAAHIAYDFTEWSLFGVGNNDGYLVVTPSLQHPAWLTGGSFGPDGSVLSVVVSLLMIGGVLTARRARL
jgi:membrane protease YdiL (CAAX protease family)